MVKVSPATVVTAEDGSDNSPFLPGNEAESGIAGEVMGDTIPHIRVVIQADAFGGRPQGSHLVVVPGCHPANFSSWFSHGGLPPVRQGRS